MSEDKALEPEVVEPKYKRKKSAKAGTGIAEHKVIETLELTAKGLTQEKIAKVVGISQPSVVRIQDKFANVFKEMKKVGEYRQVKADILAAGQIAALESAFSGSKLRKAGFLSTLQGFDLLNKAERLENGQSTDNHAHLHVGSLDTVAAGSQS